MFIPMKRTEGVSSTKMIVRVLKDYDDYVWRNLMKKYTPEELGISHEYALYVKLKRSYQNLVEKRMAGQAKEASEEPKPKTQKVSEMNKQYCLQEKECEEQMVKVAAEIEKLSNKIHGLKIQDKQFIIVEFIYWNQH
eukprot:TRINITY_DN88022_c0_g1_i1.p6 TRINITY_DN88022_c0_g1~~TRINITY_DN88022_c0_g1_i1.p6  ORF type:complete len:137 (-),score=15.57 TRINITY_DN88022_c0_g1_i1:994-1404(-)